MGPCDWLTDWLAAAETDAGWEMGDGDVDVTADYDCLARDAGRSRRPSLTRSYTRHVVSRNLNNVVCWIFFCWGTGAKNKCGSSCPNPPPWLRANIQTDRTRGCSSARYTVHIIVTATCVEQARAVVPVQVAVVHYDSTHSVWQFLWRRFQDLGWPYWKRFTTVKAHIQHYE